MTQTDGAIHHVFGWKNQYCENDCSIQSNLQTQCNPYQITKGIFQRTRRKKKLKFVWRHKALNSNLEKEEWSWKNQPS